MKIKKLNEDFVDKYALAQHYQKHVRPNPADSDNEKQQMSYRSVYAYEQQANALRDAKAGLARSTTDDVVGFMVSGDRAIKHNKIHKVSVIYDINTGIINTFMRMTTDKYQQRITRDFVAELPENQAVVNESLIGYRNDELYGSGVYDLREVITFETLELGNSDIPETLLSDFEMSDEQKDELQSLIDLIDDGGFTEDELDEDEVEASIDLMINIIHKTYPEAKYALWLGTEECINKNYEGNARPYKVQFEKPISDLGMNDQGCLFVYSEHPTKFINESVEPKEGGEQRMTLVESSLSKLYDYIQSSDVAFVTAFKRPEWHKAEAKKQNLELDRGANFSRSVLKLNRERNKRLLANLKAHGFIIFKVDGSYENQARKEAGLSNYTDKEESFAVVNTHHNKDFVKIITDLGRDYDQESVLIVYAGGNKAEFIYMEDGHTEDAGKPTFGKDAAFKSLINGRPFVMEAVEKLDYQLKTQKQYEDCKNAKLDESYQDLIKYLATGGKTKLKKRKNRLPAFTTFGGDPKYNADFFNHVMGSDGGSFGSVNGSDMAGPSADGGCAMGESLKEAFTISDQLNPKFFEGDKLKEYVRLRLIKIANVFVNAIKEDGIPLDVKDYIFLGSNAAYNYTEHSDIDLHVLVDLTSLKDDPAVIKRLYNYIKNDFNNKYDIKIKGQDVELYLQDVNEPNAANGIYSLLRNEWIKFPDASEPQVFEPEKTQEFVDWETRYNSITDEEASQLINDIYDLRKSSLAQEDGEYSNGNLIFKEFRNRGWLKDLRDRQHLALSKELSIEKLNESESAPHVNKQDVYAAAIKEYGVGNQVVAWSTYIMPDGTFLCFDKGYDDSDWGEHVALHCMISDMFDCLEIDAEDIMREDCIKCNASLPYVHFPDNRPTAKQYAAVEEWLKVCESANMLICIIGDEKEYDMNIVSPEEIVRAVKKSYVTRILEKKEQKKKDD